MGTLRRATARVCVVAEDPTHRRALEDLLASRDDLQQVGWAEDVEVLEVLHPRCDLLLLPGPPGPGELAVLRRLGAGVRVPGPDGTLVEPQPPRPAPGVVRPDLAPRQREVLTAYVQSSDLLPTVARRLGVDEETVKTHLRRVRRKYAVVGRPAPTRRDLYVRAVEDGLVPPPTGWPGGGGG